MRNWPLHGHNQSIPPKKKSKHFFQILKKLRETFPVFTLVARLLKLLTSVDKIESIKSSCNIRDVFELLLLFFTIHLDFLTSEIKNFNAQKLRFLNILSDPNTWYCKHHTYNYTKAQKLSQQLSLYFL